MKESKMIELTRACARSDTVIVVNAVLSDSDLFAPDCRIYRYEHDGEPGKQWYYDDFQFHMQHITLFSNPEIDPTTDYLVYMSSEGDVYHAWWKGNFQEKILGAGTWVDDAKGYGRMTSIAQVGDKLYACGDGGQIYVRQGRDNWQLLTDTLLYDPGAHRRLMKGAPNVGDPGFLDWLRSTEEKEPRNIIFHSIKGDSEDAIYLSGEEGVKPVLCFWDGAQLEELKVPLEEAALTDLYIEGPESVWVSGREGVILHGSRNRGFIPLNLPTRNNLFHGFAPYRGKLVTPATVRPGGLYELDPKTQAFKRFDPPLPKLTKKKSDPDFPQGGPYYAGAVGDVLWAVSAIDIYRFDGHAWERIAHPDM